MAETSRGITHEAVRDLILFLHYTGARIGETRALAAGDVDLNAGTSRCPIRNRVPVTIPFVKQTRAIVCAGWPRQTRPDTCSGYDVRQLHKA